MSTRTNIRIVAAVIFAAGLVIYLIAILTPNASLYPIGAIIGGVGVVGLYGSRWLSTRTQARVVGGDATETAASRKSVDRNGSPFTMNNQFGSYMSARPLLQIAWFSFVGIVAITIGVISTVNRSEKPQNLVGGVIALLFGLGSLMTAYYVYLKRR